MDLYNIRYITNRVVKYGYVLHDKLQTFVINLNTIIKIKNNKLILKEIYKLYKSIY